MKNKKLSIVLGISLAIASGIISAKPITANANEAVAEETATAGDAESLPGGADATNIVDTDVKEKDGLKTDASKTVNETPADTSVKNAAGDAEKIVIENGTSGLSAVAEAKKAPALSVYNGVDYSSVYDYYYYVNKYPDIKKAFNGDQSKTLQHFITYGMKEGRKGNETFDVYSYKNAYRDLRKAFGNDLARYYTHYLGYGKKEGRKTLGVTKVVGAPTVYNGVNYAAVYDYNYYVNKYGDVKKAFNGDEDKTLQHFVKYGMNEKRTGSASFNVSSYMLQYADLRNAFLLDTAKYYNHYISYGKKEGRKAVGTTKRVGSVTKYGGVDYSAVFNADYYFANNGDLVKAFGTNDDISAIKHFVNYGMKEGRRASASFDVRSYRYQYVDLRKAFRTDLKKYYQHYITYGKKEKRKATGTTKMVDPASTYSGIDLSPVYDYEYYYNRYADLRKAFGDDDFKLVEHFAKYGLKEGRQGKASYDKATYDQMKSVFNYGGAVGYGDHSNVTINGRKYHIDANGNVTSLFGIDVSKYQGNIDWNAVKADGVDFVIIRAGYRGYGTLRLAEDEKFGQNIIGANKAGLKVGVYFFTQAVNETEAMEEAEFTAALIKKYNGKVDMPIFIDSESQRDENGNPTRHNNITAQERTDVIKAFCNRTKQLGYQPGYYGGYYWPFYSEQLTQFPRWFAYYPLDINLETNLLEKHGLPYSIWQYSSSGTIKGINGRVDYNIWFR